MTHDEYSILHRLVGQVGELRGETSKGLEDVNRRLGGLEANTDGLLAAYQQHGVRLGQIESMCSLRHKRDSEECRRLSGLDRRLSTIETTGVARQSIRRLLLKYAGLVAAATAATAAVLQVLRTIGS